MYSRSDMTLPPLGRSMRRLPTWEIPIPIPIPDTGLKRCIHFRTLPGTPRQKAAGRTSLRTR
jgi:hypothetical protein